MGTEAPELQIQYLATAAAGPLEGELVEIAGDENVRPDRANREGVGDPPAGEQGIGTELARGHCFVGSQGHGPILGMRLKAFETAHVGHHRISVTEKLISFDRHGGPTSFPAWSLILG